jgi:hypothetical protein
MTRHKNTNIAKLLNSNFKITGKVKGTAVCIFISGSLRTLLIAQHRVESVLVKNAADRMINPLTRNDL